MNTDEENNLWTMPFLPKRGRVSGWAEYLRKSP
jgi:hypothetical protein